MAKESSFFEKLKKGMGTEGPVEEEIEEVEKKLRVEKPPKKSPKGKQVPYETGKLSTGQAKKLDATHPPPFKAMPIEPAEVEKAEEPKVKEEKKDWSAWGGEPEGQLTVDVYQTENELIVQSAIAGVKPENLDISMENDILTIRGNRGKTFNDEENYFVQECYWGPFSREVILPVEVDPGRVEATMKEGILTIRIPKILREGKKKISVKS